MEQLDPGLFAKMVLFDLGLAQSSLDITGQLHQLELDLANSHHVKVSVSEMASLLTICDTFRKRNLTVPAPESPMLT